MPTVSSKPTHQPNAPGHVSLPRLAPARAVQRRGGEGQTAMISTHRGRLKEGKREKEEQKRRTVDQIGAQFTNTHTVQSGSNVL